MVAWLSPRLSCHFKWIMRAGCNSLVSRLVQSCWHSCKFIYCRKTINFTVSECVWHQNNKWIKCEMDQCISGPVFSFALHIEKWCFLSQTHTHAFWAQTTHINKTNMLTQTQTPQTSLPSLSETFVPPLSACSSVRSQRTWQTNMHLHVARGRVSMSRHHYYHTRRGLCQSNSSWKIMENFSWPAEAQNTWKHWWYCDSALILYFKSVVITNIMLQVCSLCLQSCQMFSGELKCF